MKITRIDTFILKVPLGKERFWSSQCCFAERKSLLLRVETDAGLFGWGESGQYGAAEPVAAAVHSVFAPVLIGQDPCQPEVLWDRMYNLTRDFGRKGATVEAISGLDIALWDIFGKAQHAPIYRLMGGAFRSKVKTYATGGYYRGPEPLTLNEDLPRLRQEAIGYVEAGFPAVKMKIGLFSPRQDLQRIATVREAIGKDTILMVDANHAYQRHTACLMAKEMETYDIFWFEEPVVPEDIEGYREIRASTRIAIAGGECEYTRYGFANLILRGAIDIAQPDICCAGGLTEVRRIAAITSAFHIHCVPHVWGSAVALAAGLHMAAQLSPLPHTARPLAPYNEPMLEWDANPNSLRTELSTEPIHPEGGEVSVPSGDGLGIDIDEEFLARHANSKATSGEGATIFSARQSSVSAAGPI